jgi:hypothetical protein
MFALTSPVSGDRSAGIVRSRIKGSGVKSLLFNLTANGFLPGGKAPTIHQRTEGEAVSSIRQSYI